MNSFYVYLTSFDSQKSVELRLWARANNSNIISVSQGENITMYVRATEESMKEMKDKFDWIKSYKKDIDLCLQLKHE